MKLLTLLGLLLLTSNVCPAQVPHVDTILKNLDANADQTLTKEEVQKSQRYARQFDRWDVDGDGKVSKADIISFRAKFGIAADGSRIPSRATRGSTGDFDIPDVKDLSRVDRQSRLSRQTRSNSQYILKVAPHPVTGDRYFILTDHKEQTYLASLRKLAKHRAAKIISVEDLAILHTQPESLDRVRNELIQGNAKFVALAPRMETFRENMILGAWELLSTLDQDPQLDCFPGILVASSPSAFAKLIDQSIAHRPIQNHQLRPFAINQVQNSSETRSLQKSGILRKHFQKANLETPIVAIYGQAASSAPRLPGKKVWNITVPSKGKFIKNLPVDAAAALDDSNLIVMHGHGIPGMSCSLDIDGLPRNLTGKILLTGSCFSASPVKSDLAAMRQAPGGYDIKKRDSFVLRAIDNGALMAFGHQRLSSGFPHLYPLLENLIDGQTVGESYQQLINALIALNDTKPGQFVIGENQKSSQRVRQNVLLYIFVGDPAVHPFQKVGALSSK